MRNTTVILSSTLVQRHDGIWVLTAESTGYTVEEYITVFVRAAENGPAIIPGIVLDAVLKNSTATGEGLSTLLNGIQEKFSLRYARFGQRTLQNGTRMFWWDCSRRPKTELDPPDMEALPQATLITLACMPDGSCKLTISSARRDSVEERYEHGTTRSRRFASHRARGIFR